MRVALYLADIKPEVGGGFTFLHEVVSALVAHAARSRHEFVLICPLDYAASLHDLPANLYPAPLRGLSKTARAFIALRHYLPLTGLLFRGKSPIERVAREHRADVIWMPGGFNDTPDIPYFTTVWDLQHRTHPWFPEISNDWKWDHRELFISRHLRRAARVITGTEAGKAEIVNFYGVPADHIIIQPHPTPSFALDQAARREPARERFMFYPAQFWPHKNHVNLLLAWRLLKDAGAEVPRLVFVGSDKGNKAFVQQRAQELGVADHIEFRGFVSVEELIGLYQSADALIYASFSGPENLPPLEAFALDCPVIASEFPGAREQMADAALYFAPHDPQSIKQAVMNFYADPEARDQRRRAGEVRARRQTGQSFVLGVMQELDAFEAERRCWP